MIQKKKSSFIVKESNFCSRIKTRWRFPRGQHSPVRQHHKGRPSMPNPGFGAPLATRGMINGLIPRLVFKLSDLLDVTSNEGLILAKNVGLRKKLLLLKEAEKNQLTFINVKDVSLKIKTIEEDMKNKKQKKDSTEEKKKQVNTKVEDKLKNPPNTEEKKEESKQ